MQCGGGRKQPSEARRSGVRNQRHTHTPRPATKMPQPAAVGRTGNKMPTLKQVAAGRKEDGEESGSVSGRNQSCHGEERREGMLKVRYGEGGVRNNVHTVLSPSGEMPQQNKGSGMGRGIGKCWGRQGGGGRTAHAMNHLQMCGWLG